MRTLYRFIVAGALSAPLLVGAAGLASADTNYNHDSTVAGPDGAWHYSVCAGTDGHGNSYYREHLSWSGPHGAGTSNTGSSAGHHHHHDDDHHDDD
ncbi:hypothetical protein ACQPZF_32140 [Actinosynnema sp. CS-041913]|uniref:hypothetical protein n=1 Tax=Actinosynnema sp. CS-041913 TaxID=3239917 RepID=UPI003D8BC8A3